ncbi:MAG: PAS domain S-box protein [Deltaproteobacteria bacterium]|nr:PAS domain S-box protein [Deltaproteobacteria bacterium]
MTSLVGLIVVVGVLSYFYRVFAEQTLRDHFDAHNQIIARVLGNALDPDALRRILDTPPGARGYALRQREEVEVFGDAVRSSVESLPILAVRLYDRNGSIVYATTPEVIGDDGSGAPGVAEALGGFVTSRLEVRKRFNQIGPHGIWTNIDLHTSYLPLKIGESRQARGVLEIQSDATPLVAKAERAGRIILGGVALILGVFYGALFLLFRATDEALREEERERERNLVELQRARDELEERVMLRTRDLQSSRAFLQSIIDGIADPIMVINREFCVTSMNAACEEFCQDGNAPEYCYEISHSRSTPCSDGGESCPLDQVLATGDSCRVTHTHVRPNGEEKVVEVTATPLRDHEGEIQGVIEVEHDVTEIVRATERLRESEQRFRDVTDATGEYIWELDMESRFVFLTDRVKDVLGYEPSEMIGRTPVSFMLPEDVPRVRNHFSVHGEGRPFTGLVHRSLRKDGRVIWQSASSIPAFDVQGNRIGARGVCQDITDRMLADEALRESEAHLRAVMDNVADAIITFDAAGQVKTFNEAARRMFDRSSESFSDCSIWAILSRSSLQAVEGDGASRVLGDDELIRDGQWVTEGVRRDGSRFPVDLWVGEPDLGGEFQYLVLIHDSSARQAAQQELEEARRQYHHQEKMAAVGHLAAGILHEVGNPIAAISGSVEQIRFLHAGDPCVTECCPLSMESLSHVSMIDEHVTRLARITRDIAEFASPRARDKELLDLNFLVRSTINLMRYDLRFLRVELREDLDRKLPAVMGVADRLTQVFMNLLINAIDSAEEIAREEPVIEIQTRAAGDRIDIRVIDNSGGMSEATLARARDAFFTTKPVGKGTGLGLSLCDSIVTAHNGVMEIESVEGSGTTVYIGMPAADPDASCE